MLWKSFRLFFLLILFSLSQVSELKASDKTPAWVKEVGAKSFPDTSRIFLVNDFGANPNGLILSTGAIQAAIDKCAEEGGGKVVFRPGMYLTGSIYVKSNVNLHIGEGVELRGVIDLEQYPDIPTRVAGIMMEWPSALINILEQENAAVTGNGRIFAQGRIHWERYWQLRMKYTPKGLRWASDYDCKRVRTLLVSDSKNITISGLTMQQAGFWTVHVLFSSNVTVDGLTIENNIGGMGPSTDGIDIDSSTKILVQNCKIDCHDDNIVLKAGRDADGIRVNRPTEYVHIRNCTSYIGSGIIVIGSETSGTIRNVLVEDVEAYGSSHAVRLKSALTRGGGLFNIEIRNVKAENVRTPIAVSLNWNPSYSYASVENEVDSLPEHWKKMLEEVDPEVGIPKFRDVHISNLVATGSETAISVSGVADSYLENFTLENISISSKRPGNIRYTKNWTLNKVQIESENGEKLKCEDNIDLVTKKSTL